MDKTVCENLANVLSAIENILLLSLSLLFVTNAYFHGDESPIHSEFKD